ncbi:hypothetical protein BDN70DRAFT_916420 [Pholiota conissans]|uniref:Uncharacterized protein n=1 Tax=Pholiota conissans TaxID=109636 RepID=A0A9P5ZDS5_9AGAR|nr:hypothetical protein BDN70DRAFT_916420 [Pholiota conissans]
MTSSLFSRDTILKRQGRTARARRIADLSHSDSLRGKSLNIILEEDESRLSSRSPSPMPSYQASTSAGGSPLGLKARRRLANMSDIRIARQIMMQDDNDLSPLQGDLLTSPRVAPKPPTPETSPDSFKLAFDDVAPRFPSPPSPLGFFDPGSPTSSMSSSPRSRSGAMPLTPSTSDDESSFINPYHVEIQPLVITKHSQRPTSPFREISIIEQTMKETNSMSSIYDSDCDSDSEWYGREFSKTITLRSPLPPSFPHERISRPDSIISISPTPSSKRRLSKALPSIPSRVAGQVDPAPSYKRSSKRRSVIPNYPPPPPPVVQRPESISSAKSIVDFPLISVKTPPQMLHRPLPRSSVPADFIFESDVDESSSAFSFSIYEVDLGDEQSESSGSAYSQPSFVDAFAAQEVTFDLDGGMMLPVSLPTTPLDIDIDAELKEENEDEMEFVFDEFDEVSPAQSTPPHPRLASPEVPNTVLSPTPESSFFPPSPSLSYYHSSASGSPPPSSSPKHHVYMEEHVLKSKWSTSTLASVREEHERRGASSKLRLYFGGQNSKRGSSQSTKKSAVPQTPTSPFGGLMSPRKSSRGGFAAAMTAQARQAAASPYRGPGHARGNSDSPVLGYGAPVGVRRRGSVATVSDAGSEESSSSTSSSGLRRKPIPVEMFLRSA